MKILYDFQAFDMQKYGGVSNCFVQLISNLPKGVSFDIALNECNNIHLRDSGLIDFRFSSSFMDKQVFGRNFLGKDKLYGLLSSLLPSSTSYGRNRQYAISKLRRGDYDVFHPTFFNPYFLPYLNGKPFVLTVHDMIPELFFSKDDSQVRLKPVLCQKAARIVAVSEKTKHDLIKILHVPEDKVTVIYHGAPTFHENFVMEPIMGGRYFLFVGRRNGYKFFYPMLEALLPVFLHYKDIKIVCTGPDFTHKERQYFKEIGLPNRVIHLCVNDVELQNLYANALCFIFPSCYEGFGIPILEAYKANCPVLLNDASCFPEIAQDAAIYFHLDDNSSDLYDVMMNFLRMSTEERESLLRKQQQRLSFFSWQKSGKQLADLYSSLL